MHETAKSNAHAFISMWTQCMLDGAQSSPRGLLIKELEDFQLSISPLYPFMTFPERNYDVDYFKKEMLWKLGADRMDASIEEYAGMWKQVKNDDGSFNSNYGQYWFGDQPGFFHVVTELTKDPDSRQAVIPMLNSSHMENNVRDKVCTMGLGFRIREGRLNMSVHMRSSDQIWGLGTDIPTFSFLYRMVLAALRTAYPELMLGSLNITAMSSHIYSRHFDMAARIMGQGSKVYSPTMMPFASGMAEVMFLIGSKGKYESAPPEYKLANWLIGA